MIKNPLHREFNLFHAVLLAAVLIVAGILIPLLLVDMYGPESLWFGPNFLLNEQLLSIIRM